MKAGDMVIYEADYMGQYIACIHMDNERPGWHDRPTIKILSVTRYPSQRAILWPQFYAGNMPYPPGHMRQVNASSLTEYTGAVPDYTTSLQAAMAEGLKQAERALNVNDKYEKGLIKAKTHETLRQIISEYQANIEKLNKGVKFYEPADTKHRHCNNAAVSGGQVQQFDTIDDLTGIEPFA